MKDAILRANARYTAEVNALLEEMSALPDSTLQRKPADGGWSATQTAHHLILSEEGSLAYVRKKLGFGGPFEQVTLGTHLRSGLLWVSLASPIKFKAPPGIGTEYLPNDVAWTDVQTRWRAARAAWQQFLAEMPAEMATQAIFKHPRAGRLGWLQIISFYTIHLRRHRKQMRRALREE